MYNIIYDNLKNVKIVEHKEKQTIRFSSWFYGEEVKPEPKEEKTWVAIYNNQFSKWMVTNDIHNNGLKADVEDLEIIGFADNIDAIMFVVWEHQVSLGLENTILDEIKAMKPKQEKKSQTDDTEWKDWHSDKTFSIKSSRGTTISLSSGLLPKSDNWIIGVDLEKHELREDNEK